MSQLGPRVERESRIRFIGALLEMAGRFARALRDQPGSGVTSLTRRTIVIGAGKRAEQLLRGVRCDGTHPMEIVALVDLNGSREGRVIEEVPVVGAVENLPLHAERLHAEFAIIALEQADLAQMRRVVDRCIAAGLQFKTLPSPHELQNGAPIVHQLRNVRIEDWLGREPLHLDLTAIRSDLNRRVVLVTGAAGSIGSELARQIAAMGPQRLVLLDQSEGDLYFLHLELLRAHPGVELVPVICDITHQSSLAQAFAQHRPEYVIHAAAYKHVPLMEANVFEAVRNNVLGTLLVASNAVRHGAAKMLLVSTDKAIKPSSVMGATKRIAERIIFGLPSLHRTGTDFRAVRFGNVLASQGSVIPLFERQLSMGGPITVTHAEAQRYFTTIREAAQLVLQAGSLPEAAGAIAQLEVGEPVRIAELAEKLIRFSGRVPGRDIQIVFTGLRPGEKPTEEPFSARGASIPASAEKIRVTHIHETAGPELVQKLSRLFAFLDAGDRTGLLSTLCELVPECVQPLRDHHTRPPTPPNANTTGAWATLVDSVDPTRRERRRDRQRLTETPTSSPADRRAGAVCRRKTPRMGGRRQTDRGALRGEGARVIDTRSSTGLAVTRRMMQQATE